MIGERDVWALPFEYKVLFTTGAFDGTNYNSRTIHSILAIASAQIPSTAT
jgi:hypothetical protein